MGYSIKDLKDDLGDVVKPKRNKNYIKAVSTKFQQIVKRGMNMAELLATDISRCDCTDKGPIVLPDGSSLPRPHCDACKARAHEITKFSEMINNPLK